jgi:hypothetical protein
MANIISNLFERLISPEVDRRVGLAIRALDDQTDRSLTRSTYPRDRYDYDRDEVLQDALEAWRHNPLARRIVELTSQYVVGGGIEIDCQHSKTNQFIHEFWDHRLNRMSTRVFEWCEELSRSGELFIIVSTDAAGMSYVRALPAFDVLEITSLKNDVEQEVTVWEKPKGEGSDIASPTGQLSAKAWPVYNDDYDDPGEPFILHYAINRPVGARHGESDLAPFLRWLARYASWLEDRARLNRYRQSFMYVVSSKFASKAEKLARQAELSADPPSPGSILVTDDTEVWSVLSPNLSSFEAAEDGLALKKMIAAGSGNPLHFLAEPESATRTTAESAGGPTFRHYQQRQAFFLWMVEDLLKVVLARRKTFDRTVNANAQLRVKGSDISARENDRLSAAASSIVNTFKQLRDRGLIDDAELLRLAYRYAGEVIDVEEMLKRGGAAPEPKLPPAGVKGTHPEEKSTPETTEPAEKKAEKD